MGDKPDDVPSLEELGANDPLPEYWNANTTITVSRYTKERLDTHRDSRPWDEFLEKLRREHADPITFNDAEQIADAVIDALDMDDPEDRCGPDFDELARAVAEKIDYAMLASKVAEEVVEEMR